MRIRIHWKLTLIFCAINLVILTGAYLYLSGNLRSYVEDRIEDGLKKDLFLNKDLLDKEPLALSGPAGVNRLVDSIATRLGVRATVMDPAGNVLSDSDIGSDGIGKLENHITRAEVQDAIRTGFGKSKRFSTSIRKDMLYMAAPLGKGKLTGILRLSIPLSDVELIESRLFRMTGITMILAFLITLLAGFAVSIIISRPLGEMSKVAGRIAGGDFSRKIVVRADDETGDLAKAINNMSDEISSKITNISGEKAKLEAVLSSMFEGVMLTDPRGRIVMANPALKKLFFVVSDPAGKRPLEVLRNNDLQEMVERSLSSGEGIVTREINIASPENRCVIVNGVPIAKAGVTEGAVFVFHDITELKKLEEIRKDFVANVSHELRTPISSIKGYAETLLDGKVQDANTAKEFISIISQNSDRLESLIKDLLDLAGIESGKMRMEFEPLDIFPTIERSLGVLDKSAREKSISVKFDIPGDLPKVLGDQKRLSQVFLNLLDNAIKYTPAGGSVVITANTRSGQVQIDVSDTGIGIPEKDLPRIFERFYRVDKARSRELGGTGLGLSIVKHIVQAHGGQVWVQSVPGRGSTFSFTIPTA